MKIASRRRAGPLFAVLALAVWLAAPAYAEDARNVDGHTVYLGVVPAEIIRGHEPGHSERQMHGGLPYRRGQQHIMVVIFETANGKRIPIVAAGGEYIVSPDVVVSIGDGDAEKGHRILDRMVRDTRASTAKRLTKLPGPKRD